MKLSILGGCVSRDIFNYDWPKKFSISCYISSINPISSCFKPFPLYEYIDLSQLKESAEWWKKCLLHEIRKDFFDTISKSNFDFLLIDFSEIRFRMKKILFNNQIHLTTMSQPYNNNRDYFETLESAADSSEMVFGYDMPDSLVISSIESFAKSVLSLVNFNPQKIIFLDLRLSDNYISAQNKITPFTNGYFGWFDIGKINKLIKFCTDVFLRTTNCTNIIPFPKNNIAYEKNVWGLNPLHFTNSYYLYAYDVFSELVQRNSFPKTIINKRLKILEKQLLFEINLSKNHD